MFIIHNTGTQISYFQNFCSCMFQINPDTFFTAFLTSSRVYSVLFDCFFCCIRFKRSGGLSSVLGQISKKPKMSVLVSQV